MTNDTIKRGIKKVLEKEEIIINNVSFSKVKRIDLRTSIHQIILSLDSIDGVEIDHLKSTVDTYFNENKIDYMGLLLDI